MLDKLKNIFGNNKEADTSSPVNTVSVTTPPLSDEQIQKIVEDNFEYLKWLVQYSKHNKLELKPSPKWLDTCACSLWEDSQVFVQKFCEWKISFEDIPKEKLTPKYYYYYVPWLSEKDKKTLSAVTDHELSHAENTDFGDIIKNARLAIDKKLPTTLVNTFFNACNEDVYIWKQLTNKTFAKKSWVEYMYKNTLYKITSWEIDRRYIPKIRQLQDKLAYHWLNTDFPDTYNVNVIVDDDVQKYFDDLKEKFESLVDISIPNEERIILKNETLWPIIEDLLKKDIENEMKNKIMQDMIKKMLENSWKQNQQDWSSWQKQPWQQSWKWQPQQWSNWKEETDDNWDSKSWSWEWKKEWWAWWQENSWKDESWNKESWDQNWSSEGEDIDLDKILKNLDKQNEGEPKDPTKDPVDDIIDKIKQNNGQIKKLEEEVQKRLDNMSEEEKQRLKDKIKKEMDSKNIDNLKKEMPNFDWKEDKDWNVVPEVKKQTKEDKKKTDDLTKKIDDAVKKHQDDLNKKEEIMRKLKEIWEFKKVDEKKELKKEVDKIKQLKKELEEVNSKKVKDFLDKNLDDVKNSLENRRKVFVENMKQQGFSEDDEIYYKTYLELEKEIEPHVKKFIEALATHIPKLHDYIYSWKYYSGIIYNIIEAWIKQRMNHYNIYWRKEDKETMHINLWISLSIDVSISMKDNNKINESLKLAVFLWLFCQKLNIPFYINTIWNTTKKIKEVSKEYFRSKWSLMKMKDNLEGSTDIWSAIIDVLNIKGVEQRARSGTIFLPIIISDWDANKWLTWALLKNEVDKFKWLYLFFWLNLSDDEKENLKKVFDKELNTIFLGNSWEILDIWKNRIINFLVVNRDRIFTVKS